MAQKTISERLSALRREMKKEQITAYYIPTDDFHGSEYVCDFFKCREFMSGFTGSAGTMVITRDFAGLWTDGRYFIQAENELKNTEIILMKSGEPDVKTVTEFLKERLKDKDTFGFDGRCVNGEFIRQLKEELSDKSITFCGQHDLVGRIWTDRPKPVFHPIWQLPEEVCGQKWEEKLLKIRAAMAEEKATVHLVTSLEDIAWILNLRGSDIHCNPVFLAYLYITKDRCVLFSNSDNTADLFFADSKRDIKAIGKDETEHSKNRADRFEKQKIEIYPYDEIYHFTRNIKNEKILLDEKLVNDALIENMSDNELIFKANPSTLLKAVKNETELENIRKAHIKDGAAVTKFIYYMKKYRDAVLNDTWEKPPLTETDCARILLSYRKEQDGFIKESFDPIMAYGEHGAIVHYSASKETAAQIKPDGFLLSDTGGHYRYGTTDITRTISMSPKGGLSDEQKRYYTLVLKAHLNLLGAKFPKGTTGNSIDAIARNPLWQQGLDFNHGTGHGVGYLLSVHEGPNAFRTYRGRGDVDKTAIVPGMVTSDEPGLYLQGQYGIRLENLTECVEEENGFYGFRPLTLVPFDRDSIDLSLLNQEEWQLLNLYHQQVYDKIEGYLNKDEQQWLKKETTPLFYNQF